MVRLPALRSTPAIARAFCVLAGLAAAPVAATDIVAYRGGGGLYPENTTEALGAAFGIGVDGVHVTVAITADDIPIAIHDLNFDGDLTRRPDGSLFGAYQPPVRNFSFREIQAFNVGRPDENSALWRRRTELTPVDGAPPPALSQVFMVARRARNKTATLWIEALASPLRRESHPKPVPYARLIARTVDRARAVDRTVLLSRDWSILQAMRLVEPEMRLGCMTIEARWLDTVQRGVIDPSPWLGGVDADDHPGTPEAALAAGCAIWAPHADGVRAGEIARAQSLGLEVALWPVDAPGA
ncbi:MAG: glycerophosphodiester phosphodiesterase family protein, partial [Pseudomonadota bacterium]